TCCLAAELRTCQSSLFPYTTLFRSLHFEDIRHLLEVLNRLVDKGNTVVVIEHNLDVIKVADWIVDLGPEGGKGGGKIIGEGTPRSEEHTSELQSREKIVCRLLLEKK